MRTAIFTTPIHPPTIKLIQYFIHNSRTIDAVIIETGYRKKLSKPEKIFRNAHDRFNLRTKKYPLYRRILKKIWDKIPVSIKERLWKNAAKIPLVKNQSIERFCKKKNIPVYKVKKHSTEECKSILENNEIDYVIMAASNWLIKEPLLSMPKTKIINAHPGYLPKHRGLDSVSWSIREGDPIGFTTYIVDKGVDTGPILKFYPLKAENEEGLIGLFKKFDNKRPEVLLDTIKDLQAGIIKPQNQPEGKKPHRPMNYEELVETDRILFQQN